MVLFLKTKHYLLLLSLFFLGEIIAQTTNNIPLSIAFERADFVIFGKAKNSGLSLDFSFDVFYKGNHQACPKLQCPDSIFRQLTVPYFVKGFPYVLFVQNDILFQIYQPDRKSDSTQVKLFFTELSSIFIQTSQVAQRPLYQSWVDRYLKDHDFTAMMLKELAYSNEQNRSIGASALQGYYYLTFEKFYQSNLKENQGSGFPKPRTKWCDFLDLFYKKATNDDLFHLLHAYFTTPDSLHYNERYLKNQGNILFHLRNYIRQNKPMFSSP